LPSSKIDSPQLSVAQDAELKVKKCMKERLHYARRRRGDILKMGEMEGLYSD
jgi:hypothetical protein